jgi:methylglutaconyl-CoA hydratase
LSADEAQDIGLVNMVVPESQLSTACSDLADQLAQNNSPSAMARTKELLATLSGKDLTATLDDAADANAAARMTDDCKRGIKSFLDKQKIRW